MARPLTPSNVNSFHKPYNCVCQVVNHNFYDHIFAWRTYVEIAESCFIYSNMSQLIVIFKSEL